MRPKPLPRRRLRPGLVLRRHPRARQALAAALALIVGLSVQSAVSAADHRRAAWGRTVVVLVATRDLAPGDEVDGAVTTTNWPAALAPPHAVSALDAGARVSTAVYEGEPLDERRITPGGLTELAARIPEGLRAVAVPIEPGTAPPLAIGDRVDVIVALADDAAGDGPPGFTLVPAAPVVDVAEAAVTVAVSADQAPRIAVAIAGGAVSLAAVGAS